MLSGKRILVVEDEPLVAMDFASELQAAGADVDMAVDLQSGLNLASSVAYDAALLDQVLGCDDSEPIAAVLLSRGIPFFRCSGSISATDKTGLSKPMPVGHLAAAMAKLIHGRD